MTTQHAEPMTEEHPMATAGATMTAIAQDTYGEAADVLAPAEIERPRPGAGEVVVAVRAAGVDQGVWHLVAGRPYLMRAAGFGLRAPKQRVPGRDVAGVVEEVGEGVTGFRPGDEVFGVGIGTFAPYARARADKLAHKPAELSFEQAGALAISGLTALQAVRDHAKVQPGERVLVLGASGGVGSYAVQIAKAFGAEVTGVASTAKLDLVRSLGADHVVDYTVDDVTDGTSRYDVILDIGGNRTLRALRRALTPKGRAIIIGGETSGRLLGGVDRQIRGMLLSPFIGQRIGTFVSSENGKDLVALRELVERGQLTPAVARTYPLRDAATAITDLRAGRVQGKAVIVP